MTNELKKPENTMSLGAIRSIAKAARDMISKVHEIDLADPTDNPDSPTDQPYYSMAEAAKMLGKTVSGLRKAEESGKIPILGKMENGRRKKYTLAQINEMRSYWNCLPRRGPNSEAIRLSFQNFKGGVGKTTLSVHCAQYLAAAGYRVLLIDADSQGSATTTFGFRPDVDVHGEDTLAPYLSEEADDLRYSIRPTKWEGLDLIPACLELYGTEYYLASLAGTAEGEGWLDRLDSGIETIEGDYDIIIIDPPPALGMISLSVLRAINGLIIPTPPAMFDFHSTASFFDMLEEVMESLANLYGEDAVELEFVKIIVSKKTDRQAQEFVNDLMKKTFGNNVLKNAFVQSAEIDNASSSWRTVYDLPRATSSHQTYKRCIENLNAVFGEVEGLIQTVWTARETQKTLSTAMPDPINETDIEESVV